ncbi:hypothetical protein RFI_13156 [Reticulomyxa filosa]|uniref:Uncharacterized protein n=1 Tax=Reticulomyxa filosa TaxID=46433 RepID=X6NF86_RETFI|nr:hypothetical protein RFI_13156 [Reticulomyxa filosa]|eukprot:ETO24002.1 hypothetical protein RFI_13156 [Reticulomyxa filosa]
MASDTEEKQNNKNKNTKGSKVPIIRVYLDDGSKIDKTDCTCVELEFGEDELNYSKLIEKIKIEFDVTDIMNNEVSPNLKWKIVSFKDAASELINKKDVDIGSDENLNDEIEDADSNDDEDDDSDRQKIVSVLVRKLGN